MFSAKEEIVKYVELTRLFEKHSGMDLNPLTIGAVVGAFEGLASEGRTLTIERKDDSTAVTLRHPDREKVHIEEPSLLEVLLEVFRRIDNEKE